MRNLGAVVQDVRTRMWKGTPFRTATAEVLEQHGLDVSRENFSAIGKELNRFRASRKKPKTAPQTKATAPFTLSPHECREWIRQSEEVVRLRGDHLLRDP